jgi:hypothetical protein
LLFGDFDDERALAELLEVSRANKETQIALREEYFILEGELHNTPAGEKWLRVLDNTKTPKDLGTEQLGIDLRLSEYSLLKNTSLYEKLSERLLERYQKNEEKGRVILEESNNLLEQLSGSPGIEKWNRMQEISAILDQLDSLPTLRADVVKWPHHAHIFKSQALIEQMNAVINPQYFIYQAHPSQEENPLNPVKFKQMIEGLNFKDKFINSAEYDVEIISLYFLRMMDRYLSSAQTQSGLSWKRIFGITRGVP